MATPDPRSPPAPSSEAADDQPSVLIGQVADWLMAQALGDTDLQSLFQGCCDRLLGAGIPLWRAHVTFRVLHPLYEAVGMTWLRGRGVEAESYAHQEGDQVPEKWAASPLYHMVRSQLPFLRRRLTGERAVLDFPLLAEFHDAGATDYLAFLVYFGGGPHDGVAGSWATDRPTGFSESDIGSLLRIRERFGVACKMRVREQIARNVVTTYLGSVAGRRVLDGNIKRGDGETIRAVIWYSDLRGSTAMADTLPPEAFIRALNDYFESVGGAVLAHGGEILAFIGDAVLAIFPIVGGRAEASRACDRALAACRESQTRLDEANERRRATGAAPLSFGLALHLGDVMFGNIGVPERVSYSVVGPTVNEVARLEALTKEFRRPVLATEAFARRTSIPWEKLGRHELPGVASAIEILAPAADRPRSSAPGGYPAPDRARAGPRARPGTRRAR